MYKILAMIGIIASILAPSSSNAKICFLPGMLAGDGCLGDSLTIGNLCSDYTYTTPCPSGYDQSTCLNNGKTYYKCTCRSDAVSSELGSKYICEKSYDAECGCSPQDTVCNRDIYPYEGCGQYPGTTPSSDYCKSPKDGKIYYKSCDCSTSAYPYTCDETGLKEPSGTDYCEDVSGQTHYPFCLCEDNWTTSPCSERVDGCTELSDSIYNGLDTCYLCSAEKCPESNQLNLDYYWCASAVSDCAALGYTDTQCNGDSLSCPFDSSAKYCIDSNCSGYTLTECPEGAVSCNECSKNGETLYKVVECDSANGYILDEGTCYQVCAEPVYTSLQDLPKYSGTDEYGINKYKNKEFYCFYGCGYNYDDGYSDYDPVKNECLPTDCSTYFGQYKFFTAATPPKNYYDSCLSGTTRYYMCPTNYIDGKEVDSYDEKTNTCQTCTTMGYTLAECPEGDECSRCDDDFFGMTSYRRKCKGYYITEKLSGSFDECFDGITTRYKCAANYIPYSDNCKEGDTDCADDCINCKSVDYTEVFPYCPSNATCRECPTDTGTNYFNPQCNEGYFMYTNKELIGNYNTEEIGCARYGDIVCDSGVSLCIGDCMDPVASGSCPFPNDSDPVNRCYTDYNCHTYKAKGKYSKCSKYGCS